MQISVDISLYPLDKKYIPAIDAFIARAESAKDIKIIKNTLSTQLFGELDIVMGFLTKAFAESWNTYGQGIFVTKFLSGDHSSPYIRQE